MRQDSDQPLITPQMITRLRRPVTERVLLLPLRPHLEAYLARTGADRRAYRNFGPTTLFPASRPGLPDVIGPFLGAPFAASVAEEAIALGAVELILFGIAGSLDPTPAIGATCLVEAAYADEGASPHYFPEQKLFHADVDLLARLESGLAAHPPAPQRAASWTTSAFYRETPAKVRDHRAAGRRLVEMELSALYAVAAYRDVAAAGVVVVSDELTDEAWRPGFYLPRYRRGLAATIKALAEWAATRKDE